MSSTSASRELSLGDLQQLTEPTASYNQFPPEVAESILRRGLIEEGLECIYGDKQPEHSTAYSQGERKLTPQEILQTEGEIGDVWWYIAEISRSRGVPAQEIVGDAPDLDTFQDNQDYSDMLPILNHAGNELQLGRDHRAVLAITALRVVDVMRPETDALWLHFERRPSLGRALADLARATSYMASLHGIRLSAAALHTIDKLTSRERSPAVLEEAAAKERQVSSGRRRLSAVPWVARLLFEASTDQWGQMPPAYKTNTLD